MLKIHVIANLKKYLAIITQRAGLKNFLLSLQNSHVKIAGIAYFNIPVTTQCNSPPYLP